MIRTSSRKASRCTNRCVTAIEVSETLAAKVGGSFMAAWGSEMVGNSGDFLASGSTSAAGTVRKSSVSRRTPQGDLPAKAEREAARARARRASRTCS